MTLSLVQIYVFLQSPPALSYLAHRWSTLQRRVPTYLGTSCSRISSGVSGIKPSWKLCRLQGLDYLKSEKIPFRKLNSIIHRINVLGCTVTKRQLAFSSYIDNRKSTPLSHIQRLFTRQVLGLSSPKYLTHTQLSSAVSLRLLAWNMSIMGFWNPILRLART